MQIEAGEINEDEAKRLLEISEAQQKNYKRKKKRIELLSHYKPLNTLIKSKWFKPSCFWYIIGQQYFPLRIVYSDDQNMMLSELYHSFSQLPEKKIQLRLQKVPELAQIERELDSEKLAQMTSFAQELTKQEPQQKQESKFEFPNEQFLYAYKSNYTQEDDLFMLGMNQMLMEKFKDFEGQFSDNQEKLDYLKHLSLETIIEMQERELEKIEEENNRLISIAIQNFMDEKERVNRQFPLEQDQFQDSNTIMNQFQLTKEEKDYLEYLYDKQNSIVPIRQKTQKQQGSTVYAQARFTDVDVPCKICNNPDYQDDDLIVFCSCCNICFHQSCYGIAKVPDGDFICEVCQKFGKSGQYLRCPLCQKRGGAMKPTIYTHENQWIECQNLNPSYCQFFQQEKQSSFTEKSNFIAEVILEDGGQKQKLYYDFQQTESYEYENEIEKEPHPQEIWAHMTCITIQNQLKFNQGALWIPEVYFQDYSTYSSINSNYNCSIIYCLDFQVIKAERFAITCAICNKKGNGASIKCAYQTCKTYFHPECARRQNLFIDKDDWRIYCKQHTPLMLKLKLDLNNQKSQEEIFKFCMKFKENIDQKEKLQCKQISNYLKRSETKKRGKSANYKVRLERLLKKQMGQDYEGFRKRLERFFEQKQMKLSGNIEEAKQKRTKKILYWNLKKSDSIWTEFQYKNFTPQQNFLCYKIMVKKLKEEKVNKLNNSKCSTNYSKNLRKKQQFPRYKELYEELHFLNERSKDNRISKSTKQQTLTNYLGQNATKKIKQELPTSFMQPLNDGCVHIENKDGEKDYKKVEWLITNDSNCQFSFLYPGIFILSVSRSLINRECELCNGWFHYDCIGFIGTEQQAQTLTFFCEKCIKKLNKTSRRQNMNLFGQFFDSKSRKIALAIRKEQAKQQRLIPIIQMPSLNEEIVNESKQKQEQIMEQIIEKQEEEDQKLQVVEEKVNSLEQKIEEEEIQQEKQQNQDQEAVKEKEDLNIIENKCLSEKKSISKSIDEQKLSKEKQLTLDEMFGNKQKQI